MERDQVPNRAYSLRQDEQIRSLRKEVLVLKDILTKDVVALIADIVHNRLEIKTIKKIRDICDDVLNK